MVLLIFQNSHNINDENRGCGYTKNKCAELATGEIAGYLDPDDKLSNDASFFRSSNTFLCSCGEELKTDKSNSIITCGNCGKQHTSSYKRSREEINFGAIPKRLRTEYWK